MKFGRGEGTKKHRIRLISTILVILCLFLARNVTDITAATATQPSETDVTPSTELNQLKTYLTVKEKAPKPPVYAKYFLLMDGETGDILTTQGADSLIPIASTTKMVTALTVREQLKLDQIATVSKRATTIQGSKINLLAGEKIYVRDLLKGLLIASGNDTAFALAETYAKKEGNYELFVQKMNEYLRRHRLTKTTLADPAGLDDEKGRSTPRELGHIARLVLKDKVLGDIIMTPQTTLVSVTGQEHRLDSTNRLIKPEHPLFMAKARGVKTGFTHDAGHSLVAAYELNGRMVIGVVMNTAEYTNEASAKEMRKLFLWAEHYVSEKSY